MTKIGFGKLTVFGVVAAGVAVLSMAEGCSVTLADYTCVKTVNSGSCPSASDIYYTGCGTNQTPIDVGTDSNSCATTGTTGDFCCKPETAADGGSDTSTADAGGDANMPLNACNECLYQGCSGYWSLCQQDNSCIQIYNCATQPACVTDQTCVTNCYNAGTTSGQKAYLNLSTCDNAGLCGSCQSTCMTPSSSCTNPPDASTSDNCATCTDGVCATEKAACKAGSDCDDYTQCLTACSDAPCIDACGLAHAQGKTDSKNLGDCTSTNCKAACGL